VLVDAAMANVEEYKVVVAHGERRPCASATYT
jgi:hypothetical protein